MLINNVTFSSLCPLDSDYRYNFIISLYITLNTSLSFPTSAWSVLSGSFSIVQCQSPYWSLNIHVLKRMSCQANLFTIPVWKISALKSSFSVLSHLKSPCSCFHISVQVYYCSGRMNFHSVLMNQLFLVVKYFFIQLLPSPLISLHCLNLYSMLLQPKYLHLSKFIA